MKYTLLLLCVIAFPVNAWNTSSWTFYNPTPSGHTEWTPGRIPITNTRTRSGGMIRFDPNDYRPSHYDWVTTEQYRRDHILPHVVPHDIHGR